MTKTLLIFNLKKILTITRLKKVPDQLEQYIINKILEKHINSCKYSFDLKCFSMLVFILVEVYQYLITLSENK